MIYSKKAFFLFAITCAGTLAAITPTEREALLAEAAEKQTLLRDLVEKIFAQDALIQSYGDKATAKISTIIKAEEKNLKIPAQEIYAKVKQEIIDSFTGISMKEPMKVYEELLREQKTLDSRSLVKLYIIHIALYEFIILADLVKKWQETANSLNQILIKLDSTK